MPEIYKITNERGRAVKLRIGGGLGLDKDAEIKRFLREKDFEDLKNTAGISVKADPPKPAPQPEAVAEAAPAPKIKPSRPPRSRAETRPSATEPAESTKDGKD